MTTKLHNKFSYNDFNRARKTFPDLMQELITLEYILTHGYSSNEKRDTERHIEIQNIIYIK